MFVVARIALGLRPVAAGATRTSATVIAREYLDAFIVAGLVALFLITFVVRTFYIPSGSMEPTLQIHDVLLVNEFEYRFAKPDRGDIVVFKPPIDSPDDFIKRVIAIPGDQLRIRNGTVFINGQPTLEPYISQKPDYDLEVKDYGVYVDGVALDSQSADIPPRSMWSAPDRIPVGFYFMMGDNRNDSEDSHIWGFAQFSGKYVAGPLIQTTQQAEFTGRAFFLFWPPNRLRILH